MPKRSSAGVDSTASQPQAKRSKKATTTTTTTTDNAPQNVETPSKKRGRPRKESLAANDIQASSAKSSARKRGRPAAKDASVPVKESATKEAVDTPSKKRGRPAKESSVKKVASKEEMQNVGTPSKKRGRPSMDASFAKSVEPSSAKKRGRPAKGESAGTASKTTSPTKRGRPAKVTASATATPAKSIKAKTKSTPIKKTAAQPGKRGRPPKTKSVVVASTAKSGTRGAKPSAKKATSPKKKTESFPSKLGDVLELSSPYIEGEWPDLAENLELEFHTDPESKVIWGRYDVGISEGYLRHEGLKLKKKMEFDYRGREANTGDGNHGVCVVEFKGQNFTATFTKLTGSASVDGVMDTKLSGGNHDTYWYSHGWDEYEKDIWGK